MSRYRKAAVALLGGAATVAAQVPADTPAWRWAQIILAVATAAGVWATPNKQAVPRTS